MLMCKPMVGLPKLSYGPSATTSCCQCLPYVCGSTSMSDLLELVRVRKMGLKGLPFPTSPHFS